ncbi:MAG: phosphoribosylglycinamide formyltransferase [Planctomycetia bacterium]|jgi:phosphoribosylglycinamide formyltransferase-1|nr:phosphoribosylglycinamide formyltransferase [Planctomycetia bacterium]
MSAPLPIAVLISGGGTTLRNLIEQIWDGSLPIEIRLVISSNPAARGLEFAEAAGLKSLVVEKKKELSNEEFSNAIFAPCRAAGVQYVVMGGFLKHVLIPSDFQNRVINIHPALLPKFGGKGMYGLKVHEAVIAAGEKITGCTVHFVDNEYDHGPTILKRQVEVLPADTPETLQARVFAAECEAYPQILRSLAAEFNRV